MTTVVYAIKNCINGSQYIGITQVGIHKRLIQHCSAAKLHAKTYIQRAINKYGKENFTITAIDSFSLRADACAAEKRYIIVHNSFSPFGYNLTTGGEDGTMARESVLVQLNKRRGTKRTPEQRALMSSRRKGKCIGNTNGRRKLTAESVAEIKSLLRDKVSYAAIARIYNVDATNICGINHGDKWRHIN